MSSSTPITNDQAPDMPVISVPAQPETIDVFSLCTKREVEIYHGLGKVRLVDCMPRIVPVGRTADVAITRNARVSYGVHGDKSKAADAALLRYLLEQWHTSPFEGVVFQFELENIPIFVERQASRHRTMRQNQESARYTTMKDKWYYPALRMQSKDNKQGSSADQVPAEAQALWDEVEQSTKDMYTRYCKLVDLGVARELARCCLPVAMTTCMMVQFDLHNLMHFLRLRMDSHAQQEIRELANAMFELVKPIVPVSADAFMDFRMNAITFSKSEQERASRCETALPDRREAALADKMERLGTNLGEIQTYGPTPQMLELQALIQQQIRIDDQLIQEGKPLETPVMTLLSQAAGVTAHNEPTE